MRQWLTAPPYDVSLIKQRQSATEALINSNEVIQKIREMLRQIPDLERLITK